MLLGICIAYHDGTTADYTKYVYTIIIYIDSAWFCVQQGWLEINIRSFRFFFALIVKLYPYNPASKFTIIVYSSYFGQHNCSITSGCVRYMQPCIVKCLPMILTMFFCLSKVSKAFYYSRNAKFCLLKDTVFDLHSGHTEDKLQCNDLTKSHTPQSRWML